MSDYFNKEDKENLSQIKKKAIERPFSPIESNLLTVRNDYT